MLQPWVLGAQLPEFLGICRSTQNDCGRWIEGPQHAGNFSISHGSYHHQVVSRCVLLAPRIAIEDGNVRCLALGLPTGRQQPGNFGLVGKDDSLAAPPYKPPPCHFPPTPPTQPATVYTFS